MASCRRSRNRATIDRSFGQLQALQMLSVSFPKEAFIFEQSRYFPRAGCVEKGKETLPHSFPDFAFKMFAPKVFSLLRRFWGVDDMQFTKAFDTRMESFTTNSKSGSFFFYSSGRKYMVKTISQQEVQNDHHSHSYRHCFALVALTLCRPHPLSPSPSVALTLCRPHPLSPSPSVALLFSTLRTAITLMR
jgi:hypothetical protein